MILIGLGANLPGADNAAPRQTLVAALAALEDDGVRIADLSPWYASAPVPASDQPDYVNAVAALETGLAPADLLALLHAVEDRLGRVHGARNAARTVDLDLLDYHGRVADDWPVLPHPRMAGRAFVLRPLRDVAPAWRHPATGETVEVLLARAADRAQVRPLGPR